MKGLVNLKLQTYFNLICFIQFLKQGKIFRALRMKPIGYSISEDEVIVQLSGFNTVPLMNLPEKISYYNHCHRNSGYHEKHWFSKIKVRRFVYDIYVYSSKEELTIQTTNEYVYDYLYKQFDVIDLLEGRRIKYHEHSISFSGMDARGIGCSKERVTFKNIIEYSKFKDQVELKQRNIHK